VESMLKYNNSYLINKIKILSLRLGRVPTSNDLGRKNNMPDRSVFEKRFGSWNNALRQAGFEINCDYRVWTKEELLKKLREKAMELRRCPTQRDVNNDPSMPAKNNYRKYFRSFNGAIRKAGLNVNYGRNREELIKILQKLYLKLNRTPTREDIKELSDCSSYTPFVEKFGSYTAACLRAGLVPNDGRNNKIWQNWEKHCIEIAKVIYRNIEVKNDKVVEGIPDIYVPDKKLFIDAKTCGYRDFKEQIKRYCFNGCRLEFWLIFKGLETKNKKVKYVYAEELAERMKQSGREDLVAKCYQFIRNVFDEEQKVLG